jgi:hypothetical protein
LFTWILAICTFIFVQYAFVKFFGAKDAEAKNEDRNQVREDERMNQINNAV